MAGTIDSGASKPASNSGRSSTIIRCLFCGEQGPEAKEDLISRWIAKRARSWPEDKKWSYRHAFVPVDGAPITVRAEGQSQTAASWRLDSVCDTCNRNWMSRIEQSAIPILWPMILGRPMTLDHQARLKLAQWAQLKWLSLDAKQGSPALPVEVYRSMATPPHCLPNVRVDLAAFAPPPGGEVMPTFWLGQRRFNVKKDGGMLFELVPAVLRFRDVVLVVAGTTANDPLDNFEPWSKGLTRCWPNPGLETVEWDTRHRWPFHRFRDLAYPERPGIEDI